ncbi:hypothetical protein ScPMuIL_017760 [Solemya velum]
MIQTLLITVFGILTICQTFVVVVSEPPRIPACYDLPAVTSSCLTGLYHYCGGICCTRAHDCCFIDTQNQIPGCCRKTELDEKETAVLSVGVVVFFVVGVLLSVCVGHYWRQRTKGEDV